MTTPAGPLGLVFTSRPPRASSPGKPPLLVLLHGVGGNETSLQPLADFLDPRFHVVSVRAPVEVQPGGYGFFHVRFTPDPVIVPEEAEASRQTLIEFLPRLVREHDLDPDRVFLLGFSQGAIIGASVALSRPDIVAGLVMLSGRVLPEARPTFAPPANLAHLAVLVAHGLHDTKLPVRHGRESTALLTELGVKLTSREYDMGHEIAPSELADVRAWLTERLDDC